MTPNPPAEFKIEKQSYSRGAWRVLNATTGAQVFRDEDFDHPFMGSIRLAGPVCFDRKRDAVAWIAAQPVTAQPTGVSMVVSGGAVSPENRSNEERYPRGSIGHTFPEAAALMEGLLAERNELESRLAAALARIAAVVSAAEDTARRIPSPFAENVVQAVKRAALAASPTPTGPDEDEHDAPWCEQCGHSTPHTCRRGECCTQGCDCDAPSFVPPTPTGPDEGEHFPWHYTEHGVVCACGESMRNEVCPATPEPTEETLLSAREQATEAAAAAIYREEGPESIDEDGANALAAAAVDAVGVAVLLNDLADRIEALGPFAAYADAQRTHNTATEAAAALVRAAAEGWTE